MKKIDYVITVDVRGLSASEKMKVQDAYFKLGIEWQFGGKIHWALDDEAHSFYTNRDDSGVTGRLVAWYEDGAMLACMYRPTHTISQLLELAGMGALQNLNSDELRTKLTENTDKVNKLLLQNDEIVEVLRSRGFVPVEIGQRYILDEP
jgi:DUF1680 family protein